MYLWFEKKEMENQNSKDKKHVFVQCHIELTAIDHNEKIIQNTCV